MKDFVLDSTEDAFQRIVHTLDQMERTNLKKGLTEDVVLCLRSTRPGPDAERTTRFIEQIKVVLNDPRINVKRLEFSQWLVTEQGINVAETALSYCLDPRHDIQGILVSGDRVPVDGHLFFDNLRRFVVDPKCKIKQVRTTMMVNGAERLFADHELRFALQNRSTALHSASFYKTKILHPCFHTLLYLKQLTIDYCEVDFKAFSEALDGVDDASMALEELSFVESVPLQGKQNETTTAEREAFITSLGKFITKPKNRLRLVHLEPDKMSIFGWDSLSKAIAHANNRIEDFRAAARKLLNQGPVISLLADALNNPNCRVTHFGVRLDTSTERWEMEKLAGVIRNGRCKLQHLDFNNGGCNPIPLLEAVRDTPGNALRSLSFRCSRPSLELTDALVESFSSKNNNIRTMPYIQMEEFKYNPRASELAKALRTSNLVCLYMHPLPRMRFTIEFNKKWLQVLHTLTSVRHVPRLRLYSLGSLAEVHWEAFSFRIAEILGWDIRALSWPK